MGKRGLGQGLMTHLEIHLTQNARGYFSPPIPIPQLRTWNLAEVFSGLTFLPTSSILFRKAN